jgi:hypothetical protein
MDEFGRASFVTDSDVLTHQLNHILDVLTICVNGGE